ncbi:hypothetical protein NPIL_162091 [Nephila pilipes]|uniref:Uncharacterized protein n=1 Tax=Nephila pilipes TaxID=299642 RepID=A0A8X6PLQ7_NEPPI|nr:hypothetical protein NPIL_162091 [Nephila pilipes]
MEIFGWCLYLSYSLPSDAPVNVVIEQKTEQRLRKLSERECLSWEIPDEREKVQLLIGSVRSAVPVSSLSALNQSPVQNHSPLRHVQCSELQLRPFVTHKHNPPVAHLASKVNCSYSRR